ncbi:MAG: FAD-dependent oxidoreductase [Planctomycetota bacterium]
MKTRVRIVGSGLAGASVAYHLARSAGAGAPPLEIEILERSPQPFSEASAQNAGMIRSLVLEPAERERARQTIQLLADLPRDDWPHSPFRQTGGIVALGHPSPAHEEAVAHLRELGAAIEVHDPQSIASVAPALRGARFEKAFFVRDDGLCDPWTLGQGLLRGAQRHGVRVRHGVHIRELLRDPIDGSIQGLETADDERIDCEVCILATAAWTDLLYPDASVRPLQRHLWQSRPTKLACDGHPWCWFDQDGLYLRPEAGGFLCSPCDERERRPDPSDASAGASTVPGDEASREQVLTRLAELVPTLSELGFERGWSGLRSFREDREALLGPSSDVPGLVFATALGGSGVSTCLSVGEEVAQSVLDQTLRIRDRR